MIFSHPTLITGAHEVRNFDCGNTVLNKFLIKYALANFGFIPSPVNSLHLMLLLKDVLKTVDG